MAEFYTTEKEYTRPQSGKKRKRAGTAGIQDSGDVSLRCVRDARIYDIRPRYACADLRFEHCRSARA